MDGRSVTKELAAQWKAGLLEQGFTPTTVNGKVSAVNGLFRFLGWEECRLKFLKVQRRSLRDASRELTRGEYERLLEAASEQVRLLERLRLVS